MPTKAGEYTEILKSSQKGIWKQARGEPKGVSEIILHRHPDGSYTHLLRMEAGVEMPEPVKHDFYEEAFYIQGEMLNTRTKKRIVGGSYVFHEVGEEHGPFRCLKTCLILEFRYYK